MPQHGKNIAVLGGAGYIGSHICLALQDAGYDPFIIDDFSSGHRDFCTGFTTETADILDTKKLVSLFATHKPDAVFHLAALIDIENSHKDPARFVSVNTEGTRSVLAAMIQTGIRHLVFSSTAAVYGQPENQEPLLEDAPLAPINPYGQSKLMAENLIRAAKDDISTVCLRYFNAAGADPLGRTGEAHNPETHLIPLVLQSVARLRDHITVYGTDYETPDGTCIRDYVHVTDIASAHIAALHYLERGGAATSCNLGSGVGHSVQDIIAAVTHVTGMTSNVKMAPRRPGDPAHLIAGITKARMQLDWQPTKTLQDIVRDAWHWHQSALYRKLWDKA